MKIMSAAGDFEVIPEIVAGLRAKYPGVNIEDELAKMYFWQAKNTRSRPVKPLRFIENWIKKARGNFTRPAKAAKAERFAATINNIFPIEEQRGRTIDADRPSISEAPRRLRQEASGTK